MQRVVLFAFWGRQPNIELQLPFIRRILDDNPNVEFHGWNLARDPRDARFIRHLHGGRITIRNEFYQGNGKASRGQTNVWRHYTDNRYRDALFVKLDDDCVFLETAGLPAFIHAVTTHRDTVISAKVINNGACTRLEPELWENFRSLGIPLLDVHLSAEYADLSHRWFHTNWSTTVNQPPILHECSDWLSINAIGYDWDMGRRIATTIGTDSPLTIADRTFPPYTNKSGRIMYPQVGDEGSVNMLPRAIFEGFVVGHLNFGPQIRELSNTQLDELRKLYADIQEQYLCSPS